MSDRINIKNPEVVALAHRLAAATGQTLTDTVRQAVRREHARVFGETDPIDMVDRPKLL